MTIHIYICIFSIFFVEIIQQLKIFNNFKNILIFIKKILYIMINKKISEHRKGKILLKYSQLLFLSSLKIFGTLLLIILLYLFFNFINFSFSEYFLSFLGFLETTLIILIYYYLKRLIYAKL